MCAVLLLGVCAVGLPVRNELQNLNEKLAESFPPHSALELYLIAAEVRQSVSDKLGYNLNV